MSSPPLDPQWLDAQYNNRARVAGAWDLIARWADDSAAARTRLHGRLDLRYGEGAKETLDAFLPKRGAADARGAGAPVLVFIHGGYWRSLDKADHSFVAEAFTREGALVVMPNYDLCPQVSIEEIALQCTRAVAWTWRHADELGADRRRFVVAGHSAGGHLAAMLACCDWSRVDPTMPRHPLLGTLAVSGLFDLEPVSRAPYLADLNLKPASVPRLSPARFPAPRGPVYAVAGGEESEEFIRQNGLLRQAWGEAAVPVSETLAGFNHFTILDDLAQPAGRLHALAWQLLQR